MQSQALILETGISRPAHAPGASRGVPTPNEPGCASPHRDEGQVRRLNEMRHPIETDFVQIENLGRNSSPWDARTTMAPNTLGTQTLHARSVELVAQPGKIRELGSCVRGTLIAYLKKQRGFSGATALSSVKEPRLMLVMSFWKAEKDAANRWESSAAVLKLVTPLIDVCTRVHIYQAAMPCFPDAPSPIGATPVC